MAPLVVLPEIVTAAPRTPVAIDGGVRRGTDVLIALALGARFVFVGRPFLCAAAMAGEHGVLQAIDVLEAEIDRHMAMPGCFTREDCGRDRLRASA